MRQSDWPRLKAKHILIDMDFTITYPTAPPGEEFLKGIPDHNYYLAMLRDLVARKRGVSNEAALAVILEVVDPETTCLFGILDQIDIEREAFWNAAREYHDDHLAAYPDAVEMIKMLHAHDYKFFTATTNSRMSSLSKLAHGGLATMDGSPYFTGFFGGDICEGGKMGPHFFPTILEKGGFAPEDCLMIGDDPLWDLGGAKGVGIDQVVLPRRDQEEELVVEEDGGIYVRSLAIVPRLLGLSGA